MALKALYDVSDFFQCLREKRNMLYLVEPKNIRPNRITITEVRIRAFRGSPSLV